MAEMGRIEDEAVAPLGGVAVAAPHPASDRAPAPVVAARARQLDRGQ